MRFLIKIFSPTILIISFFLLVYTFYKSEIYWDGDRRSYYLTYYFISFILFIFSFITIFISRVIKEYLIISGLTIIFSIYLFEGYLTLKEQLLKKKLFEKQSYEKFDKRNIFEIYNYLKKTDNEIVIRVTPNYFLYEKETILPLAGISNSRTIHCNEEGYYSIYQSDRYGFNNPNSEWDEKEIDYLLVGDSFTHGACVNRPHDISSVLRNLSKKSVLNLGQSGNGPLFEFATLREYLNPNIKKVLWIYYENDLINLEEEKKNTFLINYLNDLGFTQNLKLKQNEIDDLLLQKINEILGHVERARLIYKILSYLTIHNTRKLIFTPPPPIEDFKKIIQLTKKLLKKNNTKLYFVYLPEYSRYLTNFNDSNFKKVKNIINELNIPFLDIHQEVFDKEQNPLKNLFSSTGHYNVEGYKRVAKQIYKFTKD